MLSDFPIARVRSPRTWFGALAATAAVVILATACSSSAKAAGGGGSTTSSSASSAASTMPMPASSGGSSTSAAGNEVDVKNFSFSPMSMTVAVGTTVTWKFEDSAAHTVSADDKSFVSPALSNGKTYTHTFTKAGTYQYICSIHQYMKGTIVVH
jgi:plastocyanin